MKKKILYTIKDKEQFFLKNCRTDFKPTKAYEAYTSSSAELPIYPVAIIALIKNKASKKRASHQRYSPPSDPLKVDFNYRRSVISTLFDTACSSGCDIFLYYFSLHFKLIQKIIKFLKDSPY